jgi:2-iminobutanoate/2-iminopropanoate deaminase
MAEGERTYLRNSARRAHIFATMEIKTIQTPNAPTPAGHYSHAVVYNGLVFVAGQLSINPETGEKVLGSIEEQTEQALSNVREILKAANSDLSRVLKMTIYISDIELWKAVNEVYARVMGEHKPARAVVPTKELHYGFLIEIEAIAATYA